MFLLATVRRATNFFANTWLKKRLHYTSERQPRRDEGQSRPNMSHSWSLETVQWDAERLSVRGELTEAPRDRAGAGAPLQHAVRARGCATRLGAGRVRQVFCVLCGLTARWSQASSPDGSLLPRLAPYGGAARARSAAPPHEVACLADGCTARLDNPFARLTRCAGRGGRAAVA